MNFRKPNIHPGLMHGFIFVLACSIVTHGLVYCERKPKQTTQNVVVSENPFFDVNLNSHTQPVLREADSRFYKWQKENGLSVYKYTFEFVVTRNTVTVEYTFNVEDRTPEKWSTLFSNDEIQALIQ